MIKFVRHIIRIVKETEKRSEYIGERTCSIEKEMRKIGLSVEKVQDKLDLITNEMQQENERKGEINQSLLFVLLESVLRVSILFISVGVGLTGILAYIKINIYGTWIGKLIAVYVIIGIGAMILYLVVVLLKDIVCGGFKKSEGHSLIREGLLYRKIITQIGGERNKTHKKKIDLQEIIKNIGTNSSFIKIKKEMTCIAAWLITIHFAFQLLILVYVLIQDTENLLYLLVGWLSWVLLAVFMETRRYILKYGYTYTYNMIALGIAIISLSISLKPYWQNLYDILWKM